IKSSDGLGKLGRLSSSRVGRGRGRAASATGGGRSDDVQLSETAKMYGMAAEAVSEAPDIRSEKIEPIREALQSGQYQVDALEVADKILRHVLKEGRRNL
ncbi:MAG: flagellar biosynthesis anti-sigma factor FlgM, partial [Magnetococcus sp. WYHC-3]